MAEIKKYKGTLSEAQYLDSLARQNPYFRDDLANNALYGNAYKAMLADLTLRNEALPTSVFQSREYAFLDNDNKIGYLLNEYSKNTISSEEYEKNKQYFTAVARQGMYDAMYNDMSGFEQFIATTGSLVGKFLYSATAGFLDGISDAAHFVGGSIAEWSSGKEGLALYVVKESDLWGIDTAINDYWNEFDARYTALGRGKTDFGRVAYNVLNGLSENIGKLIPSIAITTASGGTLAPVASALYYTSTAGDIAENLAESGRDINALQALTTIAFDTAIEVLTEKIGGISPTGVKAGVIGTKASSLGLQMLYQGIGEGFEEMLSEVLQAVSHTAINKVAGKTVVDAEITVESILTAGLIGALCGTMVSAGTIPFSRVDITGATGQTVTLKGLKARKFTGYSEILNDLSSQDTAVEKLKLKTGVMDTAELQVQFPEEYSQAVKQDAKLLKRGAKAVATIKALYEAVGEVNFVNALKILDATQAEQIEQIRAYNEVHNLVSGLDRSKHTDVAKAFEEYETTFGSNYAPNLSESLAQGQRNSLLKKQVATVWENITGKKVIFVDGFTGKNGSPMHINLASTNNYVFVDPSRYVAEGTIVALQDAVKADVISAVNDSLKNTDTIGKIKEILPREYKRKRGALNTDKVLELLFADEALTQDIFLQDHTIFTDIAKALKGLLAKFDKDSTLHKTYRKDIWNKITFIKQAQFKQVVSAEDASVVEKDLAEAEIPITDGDKKVLEIQSETLDKVLEDAEIEPERGEQQKIPYLHIGLDLSKGKLEEVKALTTMLTELGKNFAAIDTNLLDVDEGELKKSHLNKIYNYRSYTQEFLDSIGWRGGRKSDFINCMNEYTLATYGIRYHAPTNSLFFAMPLDEAIDSNLKDILATSVDANLFDALTRTFEAKPFLKDYLSNEFIEKYFANDYKGSYNFENTKIVLDAVNSSNLYRAGSFNPATNTLTLYTQSVEYLSMLENVTLQESVAMALYHETIHALQATGKFYGTSYQAIVTALSNLSEQQLRPFVEQVSLFYTSIGDKRTVDVSLIADFIYKLTLGEQIANYKDLDFPTDTGFYMQVSPQGNAYTIKGYGDFADLSLRLKKDANFGISESTRTDGLSVADFNKYITSKRTDAVNAPSKIVERKATKKTKVLEVPYTLKRDGDYNADFYVKTLVETGAVADYNYHEGTTYTAEFNMSRFMRSDFSKYQGVHRESLAHFAENLDEQAQLSVVTAIASKEPRNDANRINKVMALMALNKASSHDSVKNLAQSAVNNMTSYSATVMALAKNLKTTSSVIEYVGTMVRKMIEHNNGIDIQFTEQQLLDVASLVLEGKRVEYSSREDLKKSIRQRMDDILSALNIKSSVMEKIIKLPDLSMASDYIVNYNNYSFYELYGYVQAYEKYKTIMDAIDSDTESCINAIGTAYYEKQSEIIDNILKGAGADPTVWQYLDAYRYIAMLSNPSTWVKNYTTNWLLKGMNILSDKTAQVIESKILNKVFNRAYENKKVALKEEIDTLNKVLLDTNLSKDDRRSTLQKITDLSLELKRRETQPAQWATSSKSANAKLRENLDKLLAKNGDMYNELSKFASGSKYVIVDSKTNDFVEKTRVTPSKDTFKKQQRAKARVKFLESEIAKVESELNDINKQLTAPTKLSEAEIQSLNAERDRLITILDGAENGATQAKKAGLRKEIERYREIANKSDNVVFKALAKYSEWEEWGLDDTRFTLPTLVKYFKQLIEANWDIIVLETRTYVRENLVNTQTDDGGKIDQEAIDNALAEIDKFATEYDVESILAKAPPNLIAGFKKFASRMAADAYLRGSTQMYKALMDIAQNHKGLRVAIKLIAPFARTSLNVAHMIWDYSPFGFISAIWSQDSKETVKMLSEATLEVYDEFRVANLSKKYAKAAIGTLGYVVGVILASLGFITTDEDDYLGQVIVIGGVKVRLSDLSPAITPVITGAAILNYIRDTDKDVMEKIYNVASIIYEPTLLGTIEGYTQYGDGLASIITDIGLSYFYSYIPSIVNATSKIIDPAKKRKSTDTFTRMYQNLLQRLPFASFLVPDKIDPYTGEAYAQGIRADGSGNIWYNFASLVNVISPLKLTPTTPSNIQKTFELYGAKATTPSGKFIVKQYTTVRGKLVEQDFEFQIDKHERETFEMLKAYYLASEFNSTVESRRFITASDEEKRAMLNSLNYQAFQYAKIVYWLNQGNAWREKSIVDYNRYKKYIKSDKFRYDGRK